MAEKPESRSKTPATMQLPSSARRIVMKSSSPPGGRRATIGRFGASFSADPGASHIVTTEMEHEAVLTTCQMLEAEGVEVTYVKPNQKGRVSPDDVASAIQPNTKILSVMWGNNEVGTIQPIHEIGAICRERGILFHTDAVQALGKKSIDVEQAGVSLLSASGHKINGCKGTGFLYVKKGTKIDPLIAGGGQEQKLRSGTENVVGIVAMGEACRIAKKEGPQFAKNISALRDRLENEICERIPDVLVNGDTDHRLPGTSNLGFIGAEGETLLIRLDLEGIAVSTGAACSSGSPEPSHVLLAMDLPKETVQGSLRFSLGYGNSDGGHRQAARSIAGVRPQGSRDGASPEINKNMRRRFGSKRRLSL